MPRRCWDRGRRGAGDEIRLCSALQGRENPGFWTTDSRRHNQSDQPKYLGNSGTYEFFLNRACIS